ncbi:MAG: DUF4426 domain-containing protein [Pseudomonadota bacterium]
MTQRSRLRHPFNGSLQLLISSLWLALTGAAQAEQKLDFDGYELHYVVVPTTFLGAEVAKKYDVVRSDDRALVTLSLLRDGTGLVMEELTGEVKNLLSQQQTLRFTEVVEGDSVYYLAELKHSDRDILTFTVDVTPPDGRERQLSFQQKMYIE